MPFPSTITKSITIKATTAVIWRVLTTPTDEPTSEEPPVWATS